MIGHERADDVGDAGGIAHANGDDGEEVEYGDREGGVVAKIILHRAHDIGFFGAGGYNAGYAPVGHVGDRKNYEGQQEGGPDAAHAGPDGQK